MNEKFFSLPEEKQLRIINAGIEIFSKHEYKKASTDAIAQKAGISKGLLFHYFHNKKSFFLYLLDFTMKKFKKYVFDLQYEQITDFFELFSYSSERKADILGDTPYVTNFLIHCYYSNHEEVSGTVLQKIQTEIENSFSIYLKNIDWSKFKENIDVQEIYRMLLWLTDGYLIERERLSLPVDIEDLMKHFNIWSDMLKQISYKEEFL